MLIFWFVVFVLSLVVLVKSADYFTESAEKIGLALGISPFIIGITIVSVGTSLPELASSLAAVFKDSAEMVVANVVGSNVANILLIAGVSAMVARKLIVKRSLIDLDLPLLAGVTSIFIIIIWDKIVNWPEAVVAILTYIIYLAYVFSTYEKGETKELVEEKLIEEVPTRASKKHKKLTQEVTKVNLKIFLVLIFSAIGLYVGASYTVEAVKIIAAYFSISTGVVAITAVALGTSLPELVVGIDAARKKKYEIAVGDVVGSNIFNALVVLGIPALIAPLKVDDATYLIGLPFLIIATILFVFSGISRTIYKWEGAMYFMIYVIFIAKLFNLF